MSDMCNDNRFELVAKYKAELIESTNIETSADEMAVIDNILFRMWQMGWLDRLEQPTVDAVAVVRCKDCKYCYAEGFVNVRNVCEKHYDFGNVDDNWFCADGESLAGLAQRERIRVPGGVEVSMLLHCPFCGGQAKVVHSSAVYVTCTSCGCRSRQMNRRVRVESEEEEENRVETLAVAAWNRRIEWRI